MLRALPILWCVAASPFLISGWLPTGNLFTWASLLILPLFYLARRQFDALGLMAAMAFILVAYVPAVSLAMIGDTRPTAIALIALPWLALLEVGVRRINAAVVPVQNHGNRFDVLTIAVLLGSAALWTLSLEDPTKGSSIFFTLYAVSLCHLERLARGGTYRLAGLALFAAGVLFYTLFIFDTYGRLLLGALTASPLLIMMMHQRWRPGPVLVGLFVPPLIALTQWVRSSEFSNVGIRDSSIASASQLSVGLIERMDLLVVRWSQFFEQLVFFYLSWIPRALWSDKPLGLGLTIVDELTGRQGVSDSHSLAPGIVGEALWLFGPYMLVGLIISLILFWSVSFVIRIAMRNSSAAMAVHFALIPTLLWGGTASYSARAWAMILPMIIYGWILYFVTARQGAAR
ncbi:hypothetical protein [Sphingomicrobium flavum]|uniref:hypothetical protein n=1 Tax=Sphingomicrobium flavum TaxID=1229164 RepID=UPI0021ADCE31|nr:hypothetical protein [Sphingomicrobium flavum]